MTSDTFAYPCPDCGTTNRVHDEGCDYDYAGPAVIEKAYIDILSQLIPHAAVMDMHDAPPGMSYKMLAQKVSKRLRNVGDPKKKGEWRTIHVDCLHALKDHRRVGEAEEMGGLYLKSPEERVMEIIPTFDPIKTIYETGPVDGCKDYAVYAMVSWCELVDLDWTQTVNFCKEWLTETNAWEELRWGEGSIDQLLRGKKHVHEKGLGWGQQAEEAKNVIERSNRDPRIDAQAKVAGVSKEDYDT